MSRFAHPFARTDRSPLGIWWWTVDGVSLACILVLVLMGVALAFSSSPIAAAKHGIAFPFHYAVMQFGFALVSVVVLIAASLLSPKGVRRVGFFVFSGAIAVMALLPLMGHTAKGGRRWLDLGPIGLQPSEFLKPALVIMIAWMFAEGQKGRGVPGMTIAFGLYLLSAFLLIIQPDFGQTILITIAFGACFFVAGVPFRWILGLGAAALAGMVTSYFMLGHVKDRVAKFINPEGTDTYQIDRGLEAISAGGLVGPGPGEGVLKRYIPDLHTDFIYSVAAEEFGLVFSLVLIGLYAAIVIRGLLRALKLPDPFEQIAATGLFVLFGVQAVINIAVNLNLVPTKGMTLPFLSYGGSSMMAMGLTMGLALALTRRYPRAYAMPDTAEATPESLDGQRL